MKRGSALFLLTLALTSAAWAQPVVAPPLDLSPGSQRFYRLCDGFFPVCIPELSISAIETVLEETIIEGNRYAVVEWKSVTLYTLGGPEPMVEVDTSLFRFEDRKLLRYTPAGDSLVLDYGFAKGDSLAPFFAHLIAPEPPATVIYDTVLTFPNDRPYRILWGDDPIESPGFSTEIPDAQTFVDTVLTQTLWWDQGRLFANVLLPGGTAHRYEPNNPFYFVDRIGTLGSLYNHRLLPMVGFIDVAGTVFGETFELATAIDEGAEAPTRFTLAQNYPNPFNPTTHIRFTLPQVMHVRLEVFDALGRRVSTLVDGLRTGGTHTVRFDASGLPGGLYLYRLTTAQERQARAMVLVK